MNVLFRALDIDTDWAWVQENTRICLVDNTKGIVAYNADTNERLAAMVCDNWTRTSATCHILCLSMSVLRHGFHKECLRYLFDTVDLWKVYGRVASNNLKALKIDKHLGCVEVARLKDAEDAGVDIILLELDRDNCPYWQEKECS